MENLYRTWTEFNKIQNKALSGPRVVDLLKKVEASAKNWRSESYPKGEAWKYVKFAQLPTTHFRLPDLDKANVQVPDQNFYSFEVSNFKTPQKFSKLSLPEGIDIRSDVDEMNYLEEPFESQNPFSEFSRSFYGLGFKVEVSPKFEADKPLCFIFDLDSLSGKDLFIQQTLKFRMEPGTKADVLLKIKAESFSGLFNLCVHVDCSNGSVLNLTNHEVGGPQSHTIYNFSGEVSRDSRLSHFDLTLPSLWSRHNVDVKLLERNSECQLRGIYLNSDSYFVDHHTKIHHMMGETQSFEDYRGILANSAQAVFNGKIIIAEKASGSNSEQINKNLMLSPKAEVDTKPELQIFNDDVKAAHGATVGQIDEEQRFYLQSRGYSKKQAGKVLARAFVLGLLESGSPVGRDLLLKDINRTLDRMEESQ